jgi:hypothetical protein
LQVSRTCSYVRYQWIDERSDDFETEKSEE